MLQPPGILEHVFDIEDEAARQGITIIYAHYPEDEPDAYWNPRGRTITVRAGLPHRHTRSLIAHELGHVHYGHMVGSARAERQADEYAARLLITETAYRLAELAYGVNVEKLAYELDVMPSIIEAWRRSRQYDTG